MGLGVGGLGRRYPWADRWGVMTKEWTEWNGARLQCAARRGTGVPWQPLPVKATGCAPADGATAAARRVAAKELGTGAACVVRGTGAATLGERGMRFRGELGAWRERAAAAPGVPARVGGVVPGAWHE